MSLSRKELEISSAAGAGRKKWSPRQRKWARRLLILFIVRFLISAILYYIVVYRFKDIARIAVRRETHGLYAFDAGEVEFSLWKKSLILTDAELRCTDTARAPIHHDFRIPQCTLTILSWKELIWNKRMEIDSLGLLLPSLITHSHSGTNLPALKNASAPTGGPDPAPANYEAAQLFGLLQGALAHLQVRVLNIRDASFTYSDTKNNIPFVSNRINLLIRNFGNRSQRPNLLFASEEVDLTVSGQHWDLPDGIHSLGFSRLHFSGKNQFFEMDSCRFNGAASGDKAPFRFSADKLFFNSTALNAVYEKGELLIDTLICFHPVLNLPPPARTHPKDSSVYVSKAIRRVFNHVNIGYIDVRDGELLFGLADTHPSPGAKLAGAGSTQKANLQIYNFDIRPDRAETITNDSIRLSLQHIQFVTRDSLFQLDIAELLLHNNDAVFRNAVFGPTERNLSEKSMIFTTPSLELKNISLQELMNKRLKAGKAELLDPVITLTEKGNKSLLPVAPASSYTASQPSSFASRSSSSSPTPSRRPELVVHFYQTLHGVSELIDVPDFRIVNASMSYHSAGKTNSLPSRSRPLSIKMEKLNARIYLDHFLTSDSLIDIKRSMPQLSIGSITVSSPTVQVRMDNYRFQGLNRHNRADRILVALSNGDSVDGRNLYWEALDWDLYQKTKKISVEFFNAQDLLVSIKKNSTVRNKDPETLPILHMGSLLIGRLVLNSTSPAASLRIEAKQLSLDEINTNKTLLTWKDLEGGVGPVSFRRKDWQIDLENGFFSNANESVFDHLSIRNTVDSATGNASVGNIGFLLQAPRVRLKTIARSTDPAQFHLLSLAIEEPELSIRADKNALSAGNGPQKHRRLSSFTMPFAWKTDLFSILNARLQYTSVKGKDTLTARTQMNFQVRDWRIFAETGRLFEYRDADLALGNIRFTKGSLQVALPQATASLGNGAGLLDSTGHFSLSSPWHADWSGASLVVPNTKKGNSLVLDNLSGSFYADGYPFSRDLLSLLTLNNGRFAYSNEKFSVKADSLRWKPGQKEFSTGPFSISPALGMTETFKEAAWQSDYITARGQGAHLWGLDLHRKDSSLTLQKIELEGVALETWRDKRIPFKHGKEKLMPTRLINTIPYPLQIDTVLVRDGSVTVNEISRLTGQQGSIPLRHINAIITQISNRHPAGDSHSIGNGFPGRDSLSVRASMEIFDNDIRHFSYKESYSDSLSAYHLRLNVSPMPLPPFSQATVPLASVNVRKGNSDTLFAQWNGNKYAAIGTMNFHYKQLQVQLLDRKDAEKKTFALAVANKLANALIIHKNNDRQSLVFFERDREKFIFNYWIKSVLKGMMSSIGLKNDRKYLRQYHRLKKRVPLPAPPKAYNL